MKAYLDEVNLSNVVSLINESRITVPDYILWSVEVLRCNLKCSLETAGEFQFSHDSF